MIENFKHGPDITDFKSEVTYDLQFIKWLPRPQRPSMKQYTHADWGN